MPVCVYALLLQALLLSYVAQRFPGSPELGTMFRAVWTRYPKYLRVKELFETMESFKKISEQIVAVTTQIQQERAQEQEQQQKQKQKHERQQHSEEKENTKSKKQKKRPAPVSLHIYDLACGHGLLGVLLAYRFPHCIVHCVDLEVPYMSCARRIVLLQ